MQHDYGALSRVNPTQPIYAEDGKTQIGFTGTPRGRRLRELGTDPQNYARFARQGGTNFFSYYDKPSYDYLYNKDSNETQKPDGFDDPPPDDGPTPEQIEAAISATGASTGGVAGANVASAVAGGALGMSAGLAAVPNVFIRSPLTTQQIEANKLATKRGIKAPYSSKGKIGFGLDIDPNLTDDQINALTPTQKAKYYAQKGQDNFLSAAESGKLANPEDPLFGIGSYTPTIVNGVSQPVGYLKKSVNRLNPNTLAGRQNMTRSAYAFAGDFAVQVAMGQDVGKAAKNAAENAGVRYIVEAFGGNQLVTSLVIAAKPKIKKFLKKSGVSKLWSRKARRA
tara:strand:+ start:1444 stop:2460 length:1017 start_codon:yes stop_codon:yes gene_type:complete